MSAIQLLTRYGGEFLESLSQRKSVAKELIMEGLDPAPQYMKDRFGPIGEQFFELYQTAKTDTRRRAGKLKHLRNHNVKDLTDADYDRVAKALDGQLVPPSDTLAGNAYRTDRAVLDAIRKVNTKNGVDSTGYLQDYFPQSLVDYEKVIKPGPDREFQIQKWMEKSGKPRDVVEKALNASLSRSIRLKKFGPIDHRRELKYENHNRRWDKEVVNDYIDGGMRRAVFAKHFGAQNEVISKMAEQVPNYEDRMAFINLANHLVDVAQPKALAELVGGTLAQRAQSQIVRSTMYLSALANSTQGLFGAVVKTNLQSVSKAMASYWSGADDAFLQKANIITKTLESQFDDFSKNSDFLTKVGFIDAENFSRSVAALSEKYYLPTLLEQLKTGNKAAFREAKRLGLNANKLMAKGINEDDSLTAAIRIVNDTQFLDSARELPVLSHTPLGKVMYTLWGYNIHWANFIRTYVIDEVKHGNVVPLAKLIGGAYAIGSFNKPIWDFIGGKEGKKGETMAEKALTNILYSGAFGIVGDSIQSARMGRPFMPPSLALVNEAITSTVSGVQGAIQGDPEKLKEPGRTLARRVILPEIVARAPAPVALLTAFLGRSGIERMFKKNKKYEGLSEVEKRVAIRKNKRIKRLQKLRDKR